MTVKQWVGVAIAVWMCTAILVAVAASAAEVENRFPPLTIDTMTPEQRAELEKHRAWDKTLGVDPVPAYDPSGRIAISLRDPGLLTASTDFYIAIFKGIPPALGQMAILLTARYWGNQSDWFIHHPMAMKAELSQAAVDSIVQGKALTGMKPDEAALFYFGTELLQTHKVSDATFKTAKEVLGEKTVVQLIGALGIYSYISMTVNVAKAPWSGAPNSNLSVPPGANVPYPQSR